MGASCGLTFGSLPFVPPPRRPILTKEAERRREGYSGVELNR